METRKLTAKDLMIGVYAKHNNGDAFIAKLNAKSFAEYLKSDD